MSRHERIWNSDGDDEGSVHVLGNGLVAAYGRGPNLFSIFGPPYSGPSWGALELAGHGLTCRAWREEGAAIWHYRLADDQDEVAEFVDLAVPGSHLLARQCRCTQPVLLRLKPAPWVRVLPGADPATRVLYVPAGQPFYGPYPFAESGFCLLAAQGAAALAAADDGAVEVRLAAGESLLTFAGGPGLPAALQESELGRALGWDEMLDRTRRHWAAIMAHRRPLPEAGGLDPERLAWMADSTAVQILAQQGLSGGVLAGHNYRMAYVRDQYGVFRGLLDLGFCDQARALLEAYWAIWQVEGTIHNAQPIGFSHPFHVHEEDRSEITGYLVRQAGDWIAATGDGSPIETMQPMFDWAIDQQLAVLVDGALPFNGDETYVAGGILPRDRLSDHSAEATLLFCVSTRAFADWAIRHGRWTPGRHRQVLDALGAAETAFHRHFVVDGQLVANDPARAPLGPRFRHGVCERCSGRELGTITWLERDVHGRYQCPACFPKGALPIVEPRRYRIASVGLAPCFAGAGPLSAAEVEREVAGVAARWSETGRLPSQEDESAGTTVGYDYGFLLLGLDRIGHRRAADLARTTLDLVDPTGAWVEYYVDGKPQGTRCRPWESAINCLAIMNHLRRAAAGKERE